MNESGWRKRRIFKTVNQADRRDGADVHTWGKVESEVNLRQDLACISSRYHASPRLAFMGASFIISLKKFKEGKKMM